MSEAAVGGVLYTEYSSVTAVSPYLTSLWSFESVSGGGRRHPVAMTRDGNHAFWLDHVDPLLNVMLPDTSLSLIVNMADSRDAGSVASAAFPRVCVLGPVTRAHQVRPGRSVRVVGACVDPSLAVELFGSPAPYLVDRAVPLEAFWGAARVHRLTTSMPRLDTESCALALNAEIERRVGQARALSGLEWQVSDLIKRQGGRISIEEITQRQGVNRQQIARRFRHTIGLPPKLFARITRFQQLVQTLLAHDVSEWARVSTVAGYYDQAHMINEFRAFTGAPPTTFFQRRGAEGVPATRLRGRPSEWRRSGSGRKGDAESL
jgi:AraC-like DNA-binding protein